MGRRPPTLRWAGGLGPQPNARSLVVSNGITLAAQPSVRAFPAIIVIGVVTVLTVGCTGRIGPVASETPDDNPAPGDTGSNDGGGDDDVTPEFRPLTALVRRLSRDEYVFTVEDVLGVSLTEAELVDLPVDRPLAGFARTASGQTTLPAHVIAYAELAGVIVNKPGFESFIATHASCQEPSRACAEGFIGSAGPVLFRRPLTAAEVSAYADLFDAVVADNDFARAIRAVAEAMLQSPRFLYLLRGEAGRDVGGFEMATRLSYALWSSAPDAALYAAAAAGALNTPEGVVAQARRMLRDEAKVRRGRQRFVLDWGRLESLPDDDGLKSELIESARAFYSAYVEEGDLFGIFEAPNAYLTPALAQGWGLTSAGPGVRAYDTSGLTGRRGLLAQPGIVAGMTNADGGAIVARGLFLQAQLFCTEPPDPPATLQEIIDEFVAEQPPDASDRQIADVRLERSGCGICHALFDPLAFGFEHLDYRGRYRTEDPYGNAVRIDGWIPGALTGQANAPYQTFEAYMSGLGQITRVRHCLVRRHLEYLLGRTLEEDQDAAVHALTDAVIAGGGKLETLILAAVAHPLFRSAAPVGD